MIQKFQEFISINEAKSDIDIWLDYEKDTSGQASKWYDERVGEDKKYILMGKVISTWNRECDEGCELDTKDQKHVSKLIDEFMKKHGWINGNIILAMLSQEGNGNND